MKVCFFLLSLGLPGGDLVDGLPPAASSEKHTFMLATHRGNTDQSSVDGAATTDLFANLGKIF